MLVAQLLISMMVAVFIASVSLIAGNGILFSLLVYSFSGSLTLGLLATLFAMRAGIRDDE